jgi:hypothetical protein
MEMRLTMRSSAMSGHPHLSLCPTGFSNCRRQGLIALPLSCVPDAWVLSAVAASSPAYLCCLYCRLRSFRGSPALIAFAKKVAIKYELILDSHGEYVHEKVIHIQTINGYMSRLKKWLDRFSGVAMKYLPNYLGWRQALEKPGAQLELAAAIG